MLVKSNKNSSQGISSPLLLRCGTKEHASPAKEMLKIQQNEALLFLQLWCVPAGLQYSGAANTIKKI